MNETTCYRIFECPPTAEYKWRTVTPEELAAITMRLEPGQSFIVQRED